MSEKKNDKLFLIVCAVAALPIIIFKTQLHPQTERIVFLWYVFATTLCIVFYSYSSYLKSKWFQYSIVTASVTVATIIFSIDLDKVSQGNFSYYLFSLTVGLSFILIIMLAERIFKK